MRVLAVTAHSDLPETQMFIGLLDAGVHVRTHDLDMRHTGKD